jgi:hypothetical protein
MTRLDRQLTQTRDSQTQKTRSHRARRGRPTDQELMAERHVLQGDRRRPEEHGVEEGPEPHHEHHRGTPAPGIASEPRLYAISSRGGEEVQAGQVDGVFEQDDPERPSPCSPILRGGFRAPRADSWAPLPALPPTRYGSGALVRSWTAPRAGGGRGRDRRMVARICYVLAVWIAVSGQHQCCCE